MGYTEKKIRETCDSWSSHEKETCPSKRLIRIEDCHLEACTGCFGGFRSERGRGKSKYLFLPREYWCCQDYGVCWAPCGPMYQRQHHCWCLHCWKTSKSLGYNHQEGLSSGGPSSKFLIWLAANLWWKGKVQVLRCWSWSWRIFLMKTWWRY